MDTTRIEASFPRLEEHMLSAGYSKTYARRVGECLRRMLPLMPSWDGWDDALAWADGIRGPRARAHLRVYIEILRQYDEEGILPRTTDARRHVKTNAYDLLGSGFRAVCDSYASSGAAAAKKPTTVRNEVLTSAASLTFFTLCCAIRLVR